MGVNEKGTSSSSSCAVAGNAYITERNPFSNPIRKARSNTTRSGRARYYPSTVGFEKVPPFTLSMLTGETNPGGGVLERRSPIAAEAGLPLPLPPPSDIMAATAAAAGGKRANLVDGARPRPILDGTPNPRWPGAVAVQQ